MIFVLLPFQHSSVFAPYCSLIVDRFYLFAVHLQMINLQSACCISTVCRCKFRLPKYITFSVMINVLKTVFDNMAEDILLLFCLYYGLP